MTEKETEQQAQGMTQEKFIDFILEEAEAKRISLADVITLPKALEVRLEKRNKIKAPFINQYPYYKED